MKFAQILHNKVHWIFESNEKPEFAPNIILVDITNFNSQPQEGWDYVDGIFTVNQSSLEELKDQTWLRIKEIRNSLERKPLPYMGNLLDFDSISSERLSWAINTAQTAIITGQDFNVDWTCCDNSVLTMTAQDVLGIPIAVAQRSDSLHKIARKIKAEEIDIATTKGELDAISWHS